MFTNAARQKFPEASLMLLAAAVCAAVDASRTASVEATVAPLQELAGEYVPPLAGAVDGFQQACPVLSTVVSVVIIVYMGLSLTRAALRRYLYPVHTLVGIPLTGLVVCGSTLSTDYLSTAILLLLISIVLKRLYACFGRDDIVRHLFPAMVCLGCTPLLYVPMTAFLLLLIPMIAVCRLSLRNCVAAVAGALLPLFTVSYLRWAGGGEFGATACELWRAMLTESGFDAAAYITLSRIVLLGMMLFATICSVILFRSDRFSVGVVARKIWSFSIAVTLLSVVLFFVVPSSTEVSVTVISLMASTLMPMFFVRMENYISSGLYWSMIGVAAWTLCA